MWVKVEVTADDIKRGAKGSCVRCPVARAISRLLDNKLFAEVGCWTVAVIDRSSGKDLLERDLPKKVGKFIVAYDAYNYYRAMDIVKPFSFVLNLPASVLRTK